MAFPCQAPYSNVCSLTTGFLLLHVINYFIDVHVYDNVLNLAKYEYSMDTFASFVVDECLTK